MKPGFIELTTDCIVDDFKDYGFNIFINPVYIVELSKMGTKYYLRTVKQDYLLSESGFKFVKLKLLSEDY